MYHWALDTVIGISPAFNNLILNKGKGHLFSSFLKTCHQADHRALNTMICISPVFNNVILNKGMDHLLSPFLKTYYQVYHWTLNTVIGISAAFSNAILNKGMDHLFSTYFECFINQIQIYYVDINVFFSVSFFGFIAVILIKALQSFTFVVNG